MARVMQNTPSIKVDALVELDKLIALGKSQSEAACIILNRLWHDVLEARVYDHISPERIAVLRRYTISRDTLLEVL